MSTTVKQVRAKIGPYLNTKFAGRVLCRPVVGHPEKWERWTLKGATVTESSIIAAREIGRCGRMALIYKWEALQLVRLGYTYSYFGTYLLI